jgi:hypothetical protein
LFVIDFDIGAGDGGLVGVFEGGNHFKDILEHAREDTSGGRVGIDLEIGLCSEDGIGLAGAGLPIGEDAAIVSLGKRVVLLAVVERIPARSCGRFLAGWSVRVRCGQT